MVLVLTFIACLASSDASHCRNVEIMWEGSHFSCMMFGQMEAARWVSEHEGWQINGGWRCLNGQRV